MAPVWLILVALVALGGVPIAGALPLAVVASVLLLPKLCALVDRWRAARTPGAAREPSCGRRWGNWPSQA